MKESDVEAKIVERVKALGGIIRKAKWVQHNGCPDRCVMLPGGKLIWIEVKAPGKAATFPANAHERQQHREHERMRAMGQDVRVIDDANDI